MSSKPSFTKENLDNYLRILGKEFRKLNGKTMPAEIILIGGASVLINYGFRDNTYDIDAIIQASSAMSEAIRRVGDAQGMPKEWLNADFMHTRSYSPKLVYHSKYYKTFSNVLTVRTVTGEYLVAMKLMSCRQYKNDISDVVGILHEQKSMGKELSFQQVEQAVVELYGSWDKLPQEAKPLLEHIMSEDNLEELYTIYREEEIVTRQDLIRFEQDYPKVLSESNLNDVLNALKAKRAAHE